MTSWRHLNLFLVVQKIFAWLKWSTVFTVTTECISQKGSEKKFQLLLILITKPDQLFFFSEGTETVSLSLIWTRYHEKVYLIKLTGRNADWQNVQPSDGNWFGASGAPLRALSSDFVVLSSAAERSETELFQCRCSLGVVVTEDSPVKARQGKLAVEMTDQHFVTKWTIFFLTRSSFLPERRPSWLCKNSFSTAQVQLMIGSPSTAWLIPEEEEEELFFAMSIVFTWL